MPSTLLQQPQSVNLRNPQLSGKISRLESLQVKRQNSYSILQGIHLQFEFFETGDSGDPPFCNLYLTSSEDICFVYILVTSLGN